MSIVDSEQRMTEVERRGEEIPANRVLPTLDPAECGKFITVDIHSGNHETDRNELTAARRLRSRHPAAEIWLARIGSPATHAIRSVGGGSGALLTAARSPRTTVLPTTDPSPGAAMSTAERKLPMAEVASLGGELLEQQILPRLDASAQGKYVAVDVLSGEFELDDDDHAAIMRLRVRCPAAEIFLGRVGWPAAYLIRAAR